MMNEYKRILFLKGIRLNFNGLLKNIYIRDVDNNDIRLIIIVIVIVIVTKLIFIDGVSSKGFT